MFEPSGSRTESVTPVPGSCATTDSAPSADLGTTADRASTAQLAALAARLRELAPAQVEAENVERIRVLEELKAVCAAVQARETAALHAARADAEAARGVPAARRCRGLGSEVALARRDSPARGSRHLGLALALVHEMPQTMAALTAGAISEWRATLVAKETAWLPVAGRRHVDELLTHRLTSTGDRALAAHARALAQAWDPAEAVAHLRRAERERRVSIRPAPDTMVYLSALLPMVQGVTAYAALDKAAATVVAAGEADGRGRGQLMADLLVERLTGQETAAAVPVELHVVMTDVALFGDAAAGRGGPATSVRPRRAPAEDTAADLDLEATPAWLVGHGPIPAAAARDVLDPRHDGTAEQARVWLRRLFTHPDTGTLVAMDSRRRHFDGHLRRMLVLRDDTCRTPWCDAPIRHADHADPHHTGGATSYANGSGLCARCNLTKEADHWAYQASPDHLDVVTPTGHRYQAPTRALLPRGVGTPRPPTGPAPPRFTARRRRRGPRQRLARAGRRARRARRSAGRSARRRQRARGVVDVPRHPRRDSRT